MACNHCGGNRDSPTEPLVQGAAVILGNGASIPFDTDEAAEAYIARKLARGADPMILVRIGETHI